jgi:hypothetical protein
MEMLGVRGVLGASYSSDGGRGGRGGVMCGWQWHYCCAPSLLLAPAVYFDVYVYNITNVTDLLNGGTPHIQEVSWCVVLHGVFRCQLLQSLLLSWLNVVPMPCVFEFTAPCCFCLAVMPCCDALL